MLTINQLLTKELGVFMFKQISNANPTAFENMFIKNESNYKTRNKSILFKNVVNVQFVNKQLHIEPQLIGLAFLAHLKKRSFLLVLFPPI